MLLALFFILLCPLTLQAKQEIIRSRADITFVYLGDSLSPEGKETARKAMHLWNIAMDETVIVESDFEHANVYVQDGPEMVSVFPPGRILGVTWFLPHNLSVVVFGPRDQSKLTTVIHEFGHCMGLGHSDKKDSIMFWNEGKNQHILPETVQALK